MSQEFTDFEIQLDTTEVDAWKGDYEILPPGEYTLTVVGIESRTAKETQNPMVAVTFEVADGDYKGRKVFNNYVLTSRALGRLKQFQLACKTELNRVVASQFMGQTILGTVYHSQGREAKDAMGNTLAPKMFANVMNERPLDEAPAPAKPADRPPVLNKAPAATKPTGNNAARRT